MILFEYVDLLALIEPAELNSLAFFWYRFRTFAITFWKLQNCA